jgi:hypothetical protein
MVHHIALVVSALAVVGIVIWVGMQVLEPVQVPMAPPAKIQVKFDPKADIRKNSLFEMLKEFIIGDLEIGVLGNPSPFVGPNSGMQILQQGQESRLATMEEIPLQGAFAMDFAHGTSGGMHVLLTGMADEYTATYEIRSYETDGSITTFASWMDPSELAFTPVAIAQDHSGRIWMGSGEGKMGYVEQGGEPMWFLVEDTGLLGPVKSIVVDAVDRIWATDGVELTVGGDLGFSPVDLYEQMSEGQQGDFIYSIDDLAIRYGSVNQIYNIRDIKEALMPERLSVTRKGRVGVSTGYTAFHFNLTLQQRPDWINILSVSSTVPLIIGPNGHVWGRRLEDDVLMRVWATGTRAYMSKLAVPSRALMNPYLFTQDASKLYAVDYAPTSTSVMWSSEGEEWFSQLIVASGTPPLDIPVKIEVDGDENVWMLMKQGGIVRIRRSKSIEEEESL